MLTFSMLIISFRKYTSNFSHIFSNCFAGGVSTGFDDLCVAARTQLVEPPLPARLGRSTQRRVLRRRLDLHPHPVQAGAQGEVRLHF